MMYTAPLTSNAFAILADADAAVACPEPEWVAASPICVAAAAFFTLKRFALGFTAGRCVQQASHGKRDDV
jgi:hypothetical protein